MSPSPSFILQSASTLLKLQSGKIHVHVHVPFCRLSQTPRFSNLTKYIWKTNSSILDTQLFATTKRSASTTPSPSSPSSMPSSSLFQNTNHDMMDKASTTATRYPPYMKQINPTDKVLEVDIHAYLTAIENELELVEADSLKVKIRPQNSRPMIRTLLGIDSKDEFYNLCRSTRDRLEFRKMLEFVLLFKDEVMARYDMDYINEKLPSFQTVLCQDDNRSGEEEDEEEGQDENLLSYFKKSAQKSSVQHFSRLATGITFKGKFRVMVKDLTPHLVEQCNEAMEPLTDAQVLLEVIDCISVVHNNNADGEEYDKESAVATTSSSKHISKERIKAAQKLVMDLHDFSVDHDEDESDKEKDNVTTTITTTTNNNYTNKMNGLECEQACITFLEKNHHTTYHDRKDDVNYNDATTIQYILQNVLVNHKSTQSRSKYSDSHMRNSQGGWKKMNNDDSMNENGEYENIPTKATTGIIWTSQGSRNNVCSEFDALVIQREQTEEPNLPSDSSTCRVSEFWEAKYLVSPSSLHDAITKKLSAMQSMVEDDDVTISFNGNHYTLQQQQQFDVDKRGANNSSHGQNEEEEKLTKFGLFGMELLSPTNAVGQLRSTAVSFALSSFVDVALHAAETGYVVIKIDHLQSQLYGLRKKLKKESQDFEIVIKIANSSINT